MVWAELPTTPDQLEMEVSKSFELKLFSQLLGFPSSASPDPLQSPEVLFSSVTAMDSPETLSYSSSPFYYSKETIPHRPDTKKEGSYEVQNGDSARGIFTPPTNCKLVKETVGLQNSTEIQDDSSSYRLSGFVSVLRREEIIKKNSVNEKCSVNDNNLNNNLLVPNESPSKSKKMNIHSVNNNQTTNFYLNDISCGRNLNLVNTAHVPNRNCTNILTTSRNSKDNLVLSNSVKGEDSSSNYSVAFQNNLCEKKGTLVDGISFSGNHYANQIRNEEDEQNPFVNKGFGLEWNEKNESRFFFANAKCVKNFKRLANETPESVIKRDEIKEIYKITSWRGKEAIDPLRKRQGESKRNESKQNSRASSNSLISKGFLASKINLKSQGISSKTPGKTNFETNLKTINAKPSTEPSKEATHKLPQKVSEKEKESPERKVKKFTKKEQILSPSPNREKEKEGPNSHQETKPKPNKMRACRNSNKIKGLLTSCSIPSGIWDDMEVPWNGRREKSRITAQVEAFNSPYFENKKPLGGEPLGPKFFAELCNLWPDLIAR